MEDDKCFSKDHGDQSIDVGIRERISDGKRVFNIRVYYNSYPLGCGESPEADIDLYDEHVLELYNFLKLHLGK